MVRPYALCILAVTAILVASCDTDDGRQLRPPGSGSTTTTTDPTAGTGTGGSPAGTAAVSPAGFQVALPFAGGRIERRYTCDGEGLAPQISWLNVPADTMELALVVTDLDAEGFVHWVATGLDPAALSLLPGVGGNVVEAVNSSGGIGWTGPCPPGGDSAHRYEFTLFALGQPLEIAPESPASDVIEAIEGGALDRTSAIGEYERR